MLIRNAPTGNFEKCKHCGDYDFSGRHVCPPAWEARFEWDDDDYWRTVYAYDQEVAAQHFSDQNSDSDTPMSFEVIVKRAYSEDEPVTYLIEVEYQRTYLSRKKE